MDYHTDQLSSNTPAHSDELQLAVLTQQNRRLTREILPFKVKHSRQQDEFKIFLYTAKQLKYHYFAVEQQPHLFLPFFTSLSSSFFHAYGAQLTKGSILFICDPLTNKNISLIYDTLFHPLSVTLLEFLNGIWSEVQPSDRKGIFRKSSFEFLKRLVPTLSANASRSRKESVHKIARQETEVFTHLLKIYISSVTDADLNEGEMFDSRALLSW